MQSEQEVSLDVNPTVVKKENMRRQGSKVDFQEKKKREIHT